MVVFLNEKIKVGAVFRNGTVFPKWFQNKNRKVRVKEITYTWKKRDGDNTFLHFSVTDGATLYELSFQPDTLSWNLEASE